MLCYETRHVLAVFRVTSLASSPPRKEMRSDGHESGSSETRIVSEMEEGRLMAAVGTWHQRGQISGTR
jgi:hypothetical protein